VCDKYEARISELAASVEAMRDALAFIPLSGSMLGHAAETKRLAALSAAPSDALRVVEARTLGAFMRKIDSAPGLHLSERQRAELRRMANEGPARD
jgi:hypothetical protein